MGFIPKSAPATTMLAALNLVLAGEIYVPQFMASPAAGSGGGFGSPSLASAVASLTDRQRDVLQLMCSDVQSKEIGYKLKISEKTVKAHVTAIFKTLGVVNRTQAVRLLLDYGLI